MLVKDYGYRSYNDPTITEKNFKYLDSSVVYSIIKNKDKIIENLTEPTCEIKDDDIDYVYEVSVRHYGVVFSLLERGSDDREPNEYARVYFFNNGEIHFVLEALSSFNWGYLEREDDIIYELDKRLDFKYELIPEKMFIAEIYEKTKPRNKEIMKRCKEKIAMVLDQAKNKTLEFDVDQIVYMKRLYRELQTLENSNNLSLEDMAKLKELNEIVNEFVFGPHFNNYELEWCRKAKYNVQIELGCYKIDESHPLQEGFIEKEFEVDGKTEKYAIKKGFNILEQNNWETSPTRPYVITGTAGERWSVKESNLSAYDVNIEDIGIEPIKVSTKDPKDQEFLVACKISTDKEVKVIPKWAFREDGTIDETQIMVTNSKTSKLSHELGDYVVAKHIEGEPEYMELTEEERNTKEAASKYDPRVINGTIMRRTYDHALTKAEIKNKYNRKKVLKYED